MQHQLLWFEIFWRKWKVLFDTLSASEDRYLRIKHQLITAQPWQDWGWIFDIFQQEVKSEVSGLTWLQKVGTDLEICCEGSRLTARLLKRFSKGYLTDSMNLLQKVESGMGCPDWHTAMHSLRLQRLLWIYCPGHAGVSGNERADRLASTADITSGLQLGRAECFEAWGTFSAQTSQSITALTAWRKEEWRKEAADTPPSKAENDLCSTRQILALFRGQPWGDC